MFKGFGNVASLLKQAQQMQGRMAEVQEKLGQLRVEASSGGGMVTVEATGQKRIVAVHIEESLLNSEDREMVEDLIVAAVNQSLEKAEEAATGELQGAVGDLNLPGLDLNDALSKMGLGGEEPPS